MLIRRSCEVKKGKKKGKKKKEKKKKKKKKKMVWPNTLGSVGLAGVSRQYLCSIA